MAVPMHADFGWYPEPLDFTVGSVAVATLPDLESNTFWVGEDSAVEGDWFYAPPRRLHVMGHGVRTLPYPSRIFSLPQTHRLSHAAADGQEHLDFLLWALGFFVGMRLTATEAGFVDATPIKPRKLVDFLIVGREVERAIGLAELFWQANKSELSRAKRWGAAVHALFLGHGPQLLQYERFIYLYGALDACFALASDILGPVTGRITHAGRVAWLCRQFNMSVPPLGGRHRGGGFAARGHPQPDAPREPVHGRAARLRRARGQHRREPAAGDGGSDLPMASCSAGRPRRGLCPFAGPHPDAPRVEPAIRHST